MLCCLFAAVIAIDVFFKLLVITRTHCRCHVANEMGFKQDSPNSDLDSLIECTF